MNISFEGRVVIITGGGRALGREYALEIARRGGSVVVADIGGIDDAAGPWADQVVFEISANDGKAVACCDSVATSDGGNAIVEVAMRAYGSIDAVIHNAGFLRPAFIEDMSDRQLKEVIDVHLMGGFYVVRPAWRIMKKKGYGRVVLTGSSAAFGNGANSNYAAAKAGLLGLTTALAQESAGLDLRANAIMPFAISKIARENPIPGSESERNRAAIEMMTPRRHPRSVAPIVAYLASEACTVSGQAYSALAGRYARVALGFSEGWIGDPDRTSAEDVRNHFSEISRLDHMTFPESMTGEIQSVLEQLQSKGLLG